MRKQSILLLFFLPLFYGVERFCHKKTDGFALVNIQSPYQDSSSWILHQELSHPEIFDQPFYYLDCGAQSYVFESRDKNYVLKFFKFQHMRIPPWISALPLPLSLEEKKREKIERKRAVRDELFQSIAIAYNQLRDETALIYAHLDKTSHLKKQVKIYDKIGVVYTLNLDDYPFYVQKKARLVSDYLKENPSDELIKSLMGLCIRRNKKGIKDKDPDFITNFGFIDGKAVQIDVGRFSPMKEEREPPREEMVRISCNLKEWLITQKSPLASKLDSLIEEELNAQN